MTARTIVRMPMHTAAALLTTLAASSGGAFAAEPFAPVKAFIRPANAPQTTTAEPGEQATPVSVTSPLSASRVLAVNPREVLPGLTRPAREATLGVPFDATIAEILVAEGQRVQAGEPIAQLDDRVAREALRVAEQTASQLASIDRARAVLERAADSLRHAEAVHASRAMNDEQIAEARHRRDLAAADLRLAEEAHARAVDQRALSEAQLAEHRIHAPFGGVVVRVHAEPGEVLGPGEPLVEIIAADQVVTDLHLPAGIAMTLKPGDPVALSLAAPLGAVVEGLVKYAEPRVDPSSGTARVVFAFDQPAGTIPPGVLVRPADRAPDEQDTAAIARFTASRAPSTPRGTDPSYAVVPE